MNLPYWRLYGGANRSNRSLAEALAAAGHAVHVVTPSDVERDGEAAADGARAGAPELRISRGVCVHVAPSQPALRAALADTIHREQPDWVLVSSEDPSQSLLRRALDAAPGRVVYLAHTPQLFPFGPAALYPGAQRTAWLSEAAAIVVISRFMADYVRRWSGLEPSMVHPPHYAAPVPRPLGRREGHVLLLNASAVKGAAIFEGLAARHPARTFAAVPGYATTAEDLARLRQLANVRVLPNPRQVQDALSGASVLLMPSLWLEGFGMAIVDAMLCGVPVIAADQGGLREASLDLCRLVPVRTIERFDAEHDDRDLPRAVVPAQDIAPWCEALQDLFSDPERYADEARRSLTRASAFTTGLSIRPLEALLARRPQARPAAASAPRRSAQRSVVEALSPARRDELMRRLKKRPPAAEIPSVGPRADYPLSSAQERLWFLQQLEPQSTAYNLTLCVRVEGPLDMGRLQASFQSLVSRHAVLRTMFRSHEGTPRQVILPEASTTLAFVDAGHDVDAETRALELVARLRDTPFDFSQGPPVRAMVARVGEDRHVVTLVCHHALIDGWSFSIVAKDWIALYDAAPLDALPLRFVDFVEWHRSRSHAPDLAYWKERLNGSTALDLPLDRPRVPIPRHRGAACPFRLSRHVTEELNDLARRHGATLFMMLVALVQTLLKRYTQEEAISVGAPAADRPCPELEGVAGCFIETLVLRTTFEGDPSFLEILARVRQSVLDALAHRGAPFEKIVDELRPERDLSRNPLFDVLVVMQNAPAASGAPSSLHVTPVAIPQRAALFDITVGVTETPDGLVGEIEYDVDLFDEATIVRMVTHLETLVDVVRRRPDARIGAHALEAPSLRRSSPPPFVSLFDAFARQAALTPGATAVRHASESVDYGELADRARRISGWLRERGARTDQPIAVELPRVPNLIAAILGILRSGAAYLPLDGRWPAARRAFVVAQAQPALTLTEATVREALGGEPRDPGAAEPPPEAAAYVLYTSGSTGQPKGVIVEQRAAAAFVAWAVRHFGPRDLRIVLASTSVCFDLSVFEIFAPLAAGGSAILVDDLLSATAEELAGSTLINTVPSAARALMQAGAFPREVPVVALAGEALAQDLVDDLYRDHAAGRVYDLYGPTEATTYATCALREPGGIPTIGVPIDGTEILILDRYGHPIPDGIAGEIYIGGAGLARGYVGRPASTAERFVPHPFRPDERLYRTGDRAVRTRAGSLRFLGRIDRQVKIRGYRIEPGEIEHVLVQAPGVREAAVAAHGDRLVAWICGDIVPAQATAFLAARLPSHMIPSAIHQLGQLPRLPNGKTDWRALDDAAAAAPAPATTIAWPSTTAELLASIWESILGIAVSSPQDSFFELGGHSLQAVQVVARIQQSLGVDVPLRAVFLSPRLIDLARVVDGAAATMPIPALPGEREYPLSFAQSRMWHLDAFRPENPAYNIPSSIRVRGPLDRAALQRAWNALVQRQSALRTVFPDAYRQSVLPAFSPPIGLVDLSGLPEAARMRELDRLLSDETVYGFALAEGPPLRVRLVRLAELDHVLVTTLHHILADAWSMQILLREWALLYEAELGLARPDLPSLPRSYGEYAAWQRQALDRGQLDEAVEYWRGVLRDIPPLEIRTDRERTSHLDNTAGTLSLRLAPELLRAMRAVCREEGATLFMGIVAAWIGSLWRYSGQNEIAVGAPVAGRMRSEAEWLIGCFVNTVIVRVRCGDDPTFRELLRRVRQAALDAYTHQEVPFERLVEETSTRFQQGRSALFQSMLTLQNVPVYERAAVGGLTLEPIEVAAQKAKAELALSLHERDGGLSGVLEYDAGLFDESTVASLLASVEKLAEAWTDDPDRRLGAPAIGQDPVKPAFVDTSKPLSWLAGTSDAIAVRAEAETWTYRDLHAFANGFAAALAARGIGPESVVAVCAGRTPQLAGAFVGTLKAGAAFLGLDPDLPPSRLAALVSESRARILVVDAHQDWAWTHPTLRLSDVVPAAAFTGPSLDPDHLAYVVFTSGTTGLPKCVGSTHHGVNNLSASVRRAFGVQPSDVVLQFSSVSFDAFVWEMVIALGAGASLRVGARDGHATVATLPPSYAAVLEPPDDIHTLVVAGEACAAHALDAWWRSDRRIVNAYGPSETTVCAAMHVCAPEEGAPPIGKAIAHAALYVLDRHLNPVPPGVDGELFIGGAAVARGYLNDVRQTAASFLADPFAGEPGARMYRSGDVVRCRADGSLLFVGRRDQQVKLHGYRIELGEVEAAVAEAPGVTGAVVMLRDDRLVAYVRGQGWTTASVIAHTQRRLPKYMTPAMWVAVDEFPTTITGKIDRTRLAQQSLPAAIRCLDPPRTPAEQILASIWKEQLRLEDVGIHEDYFELGGDSVLGIRILSRARQAGLQLEPRQLFDHPTIAGLAGVAQWPAARTLPVDAAPLSPMQRWFFGHAFADPHHFNQAVLLRPRLTIRPEALAPALERVLAAHAALRVRFERQDGEWRQLLQPGAPRAVCEIDLAATADPGGALAIALDALQESLDPFAGVNIRLALIHLPDGEQRIWIGMHHLVCDAISWGTLVEDLERTYEASPGLRSPEPSATDYAWLARSSRPVETVPGSGLAMSRLPRDGDGANLVSSEASVVTMVNAQAGPALERRILEAVAGTLARWMGADHVLVDVERHGRDAETLRTIGWFTTIVPVRIGANAWHELPPFEPGAEVCFNYFGRLTSYAAPVAYELAPESPGRTRSPRQHRTHVIDVTASLGDDGLHVTWTFSRDLHHRSTIERLAAETVRLLEGERSLDGALAGVGPAEIAAILERYPHAEDILPVTPLQEGLLFHQLEASETAPYHQQIVSTIHAEVDAELLREAWTLALVENPALRAAFVPTEAGRSVQVICGSPDPSWRIQDWRGMPAGEQTAALQRLLADDRRQPFDVARAPLMRFSLLRVADAEFRFVWSHHHILLDGWSLPILIGRVLTHFDSLRQGRAGSPRVSHGWRSYLEWLASRPSGEALAYWRRRLAGLDAPTALPLRRSTAAERRSGTGRESLTFTESETAALEAACRSARATLGAAIAGAWGILLARYAGTDDVVAGLTFAMRPPEVADSETLVGLLLNTLPLRVRTNGACSVREWLRQVRSDVADLQRHGFASLSDVGRAGGASAPLFDSIVVVENYPMPASGSSPLAISGIEAHERTHYAISLGASPGPRLGLRLTFDASWFDAVDVRRLLEELHLLLVRIAASLDEPLSRVASAAPSASQRRGLEVERAPRLLHEQFEDSVARNPHAVAVVTESGATTYRELDGHASVIARELRAAGVGTEDIVAVRRDRSVRLAASVLGVLKAGAAYLLLDPEDDDERQRGMIRDSGAVALLDSRGLARLDRSTPAGSAARRPGPENLAYVVYTSGTTGRPKACLIEHRAIGNRLEWSQACYPLHGGDRVLQCARLGFDFAIWELHAPWLAGAAVVLPDPDDVQDVQRLGALIDRQRVTIAHFVPVALAALLEGPKRPSLRLVFSGGEALPVEIARRFLDTQSARLVNQYGPAEATIDATHFECGEPFEGDVVPIGHPVDNVDMVLVSRTGRPVAWGGIGEICVGGAALARGYLGRPALTAERFVPHPYPRHPGERLYRTGDLGRWRADGALEFRGRLDRQVKVRGVRVEPAEVEACLLRCPGVVQSRVVARRTAAGDSLSAFVVLGDGQRIDGVRAHIERQLPAVMRPATLASVDGIPVGPTGKIDDNRLLALVQLRTPGGRAPRSEWEALCCSVWGAVLGVPLVSIDDDFYALGGDSIAATRIVSRLTRATSAQLSVRLVLENPTVCRLADALALAPAVAYPEPGEFDRTPLTLTQAQLWLLDRTAGGQARFHVASSQLFEGPLDLPALSGAFDTLVEHYEILRTVFRFDEDGLWQEALPPTGGVLDVIDLRSLDEVHRWAEARRLAADERIRPFDLERDRPFRARLLRIDDRRHLLLVTAHHIVCDGWSSRLIATRLAASYRGLRLAPPARQFSSVARLERSALHAGAFDGQLRYWLDRLDGLPPLPAAGPAGAAIATVVWDDASVAGVRRFAATLSVTPFMAVLAAFHVLLRERLQVTDLGIATLLAQRARADWEEQVGLFLNTVVVRIDAGASPRFGDVVAQVREGVLQAHCHGDVPFPLVAHRMMEAGQSLARSCRALLVFNNVADAPGELGIGNSRPWESSAEALSAPTTFSWILNVNMSQAAMELTLFGPEQSGETPVELLARLRRIVDRMLLDPARRVSE